MMRKTRLIFQDDVKNGYIHYINFKRDLSGALETFRKYILPINGVKLNIDANNNYLIILLDYDTSMENYQRILENDWIILTEWLKEEDIQFAYPSMYDDWSIIIPIDSFVEWVLKGEFIKN